MFEPPQTLLPAIFFSFFFKIPVAQTVMFSRGKYPTAMIRSGGASDGLWLMAEEARDEDFGHVGGLRTGAANTHPSEGEVGGPNDKRRGVNFHNSPSALTETVMTEKKEVEKAERWASPC